VARPEVNHWNLLQPQIRSSSFVLLVLTEQPIRVVCQMPKLFISYSHRDEKALGRLHKHLAPLRRDGTIETWYDRAILAGDNVDRDIDANLADSDVFIALVSPDFLDSDYCQDREMTEALRRHDEGTIRVIPVILESCDWKSTPLKKLKALPKDGEPISLWNNENVAYTDVVIELRRVLQQPSQLGSRQAQRPSSPPDTDRRQRKYRIKKQFDRIDRADFREKSFDAIRIYFRKSIDELNDIDDIRARFSSMSDTAFTCTVINKAMRNQEAHITVHGSGAHFGDGINFSFAAQAPDNTSNGSIQINADEYEIFLTLDHFGYSSDRRPLSAGEAADALWRKFIEHAGIEHD
jgi:hypothetical protein